MVIMAAAKALVDERPCPKIRKPRRRATTGLT
jgi:hypothetical protein